MKKILLFIQMLFLVTIVSYSQTIIDNIVYKTLSEFPAEVEVQDSPNATGDIVIPSTVNINGKNYSVTSIGYEAFRSNQLETVTIPKSVTSIGERAFFRNQLETVTIPDSVTTIGKNAFSENQLKTVTIGNSVTSIGESIFHDNQLETVTIPNSVTSIGYYAFSENQLKTVTIPNSVISVENYAFSENQLETVTIGNSVTSIGPRAFSNNQLETLIIPNSVTSIGNYAFSVNQLKTVIIPNSVTSIGTYAFYDNQLETVTVEQDIPLEIIIYVFALNDLSLATLYVPTGTKEDYENAYIWKDFGSIVEESDSNKCKETIYDTVRVTVTDTLRIKLNVTTGIDHKNTDSEIKVYPNPAVDKINISISDASVLNNYKLELRNTTSTLLWEQTINTSDYSIDVSSLEGKGLYFLSIFKENGELIDVRKIILE